MVGEESAVMGIIERRIRYHWRSAGDPNQTTNVTGARFRHSVKTTATFYIDGPMTGFYSMGLGNSSDSLIGIIYH